MQINFSSYNPPIKKCLSFCNDGGITVTNTAYKFESDGICYKTEEHNDICEDTSSPTTIPTKPTS